MWWQPALRILVEERPRGNDDEEGESGSCKSNVESQADVLAHVAHEESDDLIRTMSLVMIMMQWALYVHQQRQATR